MEQESLSEQTPTNKKGRQRKKQLYSSIQRLMEFYFSDANLNKDRFLSQLLEADSSVDLNIFLKFNKIRRLTANADDIAKSIKKSSLLTLSEDSLKVSRINPVLIKENIDKCTIYVENIKSDTTHDWLINLFSDYGKVDYVSIPKFKQNRVNKGFAFVEFSTEDAANAAVKYFEEIGAKMSSKIAPETLKSIATFEPDENVTREVEKGIEEGKISSKIALETLQSSATFEPGENVTTKVEKGMEEGKIRSKIALETLKSSATFEPDENVTRKVEKGIEEGKIRSKIALETLQSSATFEPDENITRKVEKGIEEGKIRSKNALETLQSSATFEPDENVSTKMVKAIEEGKISSKRKFEGTEVVDEPIKKAKVEENAKDKKKKHKPKKSKKKMIIKELGLQVLPKHEWKKLRNQYLDMQKKKMKQLKMHLNKRKFANKYDNRSKLTETPPRSHDNNVTTENAPIEDEKLKFIRGVIVKFKPSDLSLDAKKLKTDLKTQTSGIKYVDLPHEVGNTEIYVRFADTHHANKFLTNSLRNFGDGALLDGDDEQAYWSKIKEDRQYKMTKGQTKGRGREKLLKKAERELGKHIRFDDNRDDE